MDIYNAIMKAANWIETNPECFNFGTCRVPQDCGSPGCALGWIGHFYNGGKQRHHDDVSTEILHLGDKSSSDFAFYRMMDALSSRDWRRNAKACAKGLRLYAAKYHAPAKVVQPPDWNAIAARQTVGEHERSQELA